MSETIPSAVAPAMDGNVASPGAPHVNSHAPSDSPVPEWTPEEREKYLAQYGDEAAARQAYEKRWRAMRIAQKVKEEALAKLANSGAKQEAAPAESTDEITDVAEQKNELPPYSSPAADLRAEARRLAGMDTAERALQKKNVTEKFGVSLTDLNAIIKEIVPKKGSDESESPEPFADLEPWPDPVDGAALLTDISATFARHLVLPQCAADALALWVLHCHAHETAAISPILAITSPTPECGKTTLLLLLRMLVRRPLPASNITAAATFRAIEKWNPTLLIDEADTFLRENDELRGVVNSGHSRSAAFVLRTTGDDHEPRAFSTWAPKAIALIGKLAPTLASRAIHVQMRRMAGVEKIERVRADRLDHLTPLARQAATWSAEHAQEIRQAEPGMPDALAGRTADNWRHLLAIASVAGGDWPARARRAADTLSGTDSSEVVSIKLLTDLYNLFEERHADRLSSTEIAAALAEMEDRPWPEFSHGKPITARGIASQLERFEIAPKKFREAGYTPGTRGYDKEQFADAFARYLRSQTSQAPQRHNPQKPSNSSTICPPQARADVADTDTQKPRHSATCGAVANTNPGSGRTEIVSGWSDQF